MGSSLAARRAGTSSAIMTVSMMARPNTDLIYRVGSMKIDDIAKILCP